VIVYDLDVDARGKFLLYLGLLALIGIGGFAVVRDWKSRSIDLEYHLPNRPPAEEIVRGIELAYQEHGGGAGPYRVTLVAGESRRERALTLPGLAPPSDVLYDFPSMYPVPESWGVCAIDPASDAEFAAVLAWMKANRFGDILMYGGAPFAQKARAAGFRVSVWPDEPYPDTPPSLVILKEGDPAVELRRARSEGYSGPVLMWSTSLWTDELRDLEGVFVCLAPRRPGPESFVRAYVARYGSPPTQAAFGGYSSCDFAMRTLAKEPLLKAEELNHVAAQLRTYNPWREPVGEARVCEVRGGVFHPWTSE
jgi:hypothetical protein